MDTDKLSLKSLRVILTRSSTWLQRARLNCKSPIIWDFCSLLYLTWQLARNALLLACVAFKAEKVDIPVCARSNRGLEEMAKHFFHCSMLRPLWDYVNEVTACIDPKQFAILDVVHMTVLLFQGRGRNELFRRS